MESVLSYGVNQTYFQKIQHLHKILNQSRPLIKICGNKFTSEAFKVASFKPDFMGWIFSPFSPRRITLDKAEYLIKNIQNAHPEIFHVGVFSGNSVYEIFDIVRKLNQKTRGLDFIQITEGSGFIFRLRTILQQEHIFIPVIPVIRPNGPITEDLFFPSEPSLFWILDKFDPNKKGGTGKTIPKEYFIGKIKKSFLIAGGITPENAIEYLKLSNAKGVDISSGLEDAPGIKNEKKIQQLLDKIYNFSYS
jgi:phosphoribosylanthranilate isomerase